MNRKNLAHIWANQTDAELSRGRSVQASAARFEGPAFWHHATVIARIYQRNGARLVLLDSARFSATTSQVQASLRSAMRDSDVNISAEFGRRGQSLQLSGLEIWEACKAECAEYIEQASKARARAPFLIDCARDAVTKAESVRAFFGLRNKPFAPDLSELVAHAKHQAARVADLAAKAEARKAKARATYGPELMALWRAHGERDLKWSHLSEAMKRAGCSSFPVAPFVFSPGFDGNAALRLSVDGSRVETSQHAQVLTRTVRFLWAFCRHAKAMAEPVAAEVVARFPRLDNYNASSIDAGGNLTAGCHRIPFAEVEGIARELGLPPFDGTPAEAPTIPESAEVLA